jgi:hypothetical protein
MCGCTKSGPGFLISYGLVLFYGQRFNVRCHCFICTFYYTFVDDNKLNKIHTYEVVPYQYPLVNIVNGLYDLILHLA